MILHLSLEQRSEEWHKLRVGKMTASEASTLITPTGKPSSQYKKSIARNIAEKMGWQDPESFHPTYWVQRGIDMEQECLNWFAVEVGETEPCGFIESDDHVFGLSPDAIMWDGDQLIPIEAKVPAPTTMIQWILDGGVPTEHLPQVHFALAITGAPYAYFIAYCPLTQPIIIKVLPDEYTATLRNMMANYKEAFETAFIEITGIEYGTV